ncbi:DNA-directed RNA polymerase subunit beta, partial [Patescibacteria group bacterium]|nr:DNA-directed RNA polymerase subunit beta [Patescibacteria group bacterium]
MKTKSFSKSKLTFHLPPLLIYQKESYNHFWKEGLKEVFEETFPIQDYTQKQFELEFRDYKLDKPRYRTGQEAKENDDSFDAPLRVKVRLKNLRTGEIKQQEVFLGNFPVMTEKGTFVINGVERVVISQLIRSPGVFFTARSLQGKNFFGAKIIPSRGAWLEFETD